MMADVRRVVFAIVLGYLFNGLLVALSEWILAKDLTGARYFVSDVITQCAIEIGAGYLCGRVARHAAGKTAVLGLVFLGLLAGAISLVMSWSQEPHWYGIALLAIWSPCLWLGYHLQSRVSRA